MYCNIVGLYVYHMLYYVDGAWSSMKLDAGFLAKKEKKKRHIIKGFVKKCAI